MSFGDQVDLLKYKLTRTIDKSIKLWNITIKLIKKVDHALDLSYLKKFNESLWMR